MSDQLNPACLRQIAADERTISAHQRGEAIKALEWAANRIERLEGEIEAMLTEHGIALEIAAKSTQRTNTAEAESDALQAELDELKEVLKEQSE